MQRPVPIDQRAGSPAVQRLSAFEYRYLTEFQSHEPEFDYLKSLEIEEKINQVRDAGLILKLCHRASEHTIASCPSALSIGSDAMQMVVS